MQGAHVAAIERCFPEVMGRFHGLKHQAFLHATRHDVALNCCSNFDCCLDVIRRAPLSTDDWMTTPNLGSSHCHPLTTCDVLHFDAGGGSTDVPAAYCTVLQDRFAAGLASHLQRRGGDGHGDASLATAGPALAEGTPQGGAAAAPADDVAIDVRPCSSPLGLF